MAALFMRLQVFRSNKQYRCAGYLHHNLVFQGNRRHRPLMHPSVLSNTLSICIQYGRINESSQGAQHPVQLSNYYSISGLGADLLLHSTKQDN